MDDVDLTMKQWNELGDTFKRVLMRNRTDDAFPTPIFHTLASGYGFKGEDAHECLWNIPCENGELPPR